MTYLDSFVQTDYHQWCPGSANLSMPLPFIYGGCPWESPTFGGYSPENGLFMNIFFPEHWWTGSGYINSNPESYSSRQLNTMDYHSYHSSHGFNISSNGMMCTGGFSDGIGGPCGGLGSSPDYEYGGSRDSSPGLFYVSYLNEQLSGWPGGGSQY